MLRMALNLHGQHHVTNQELYKSPLRISETVRRRRLRLRPAGHNSHHYEETASKVLLWPTTVVYSVAFRPCSGLPGLPSVHLPAYYYVQSQFFSFLLINCLVCSFLPTNSLDVKAVRSFIAELHARAKRERGRSPIAKEIYPSQKIW